MLLIIGGCWVRTRSAGRRKTPGEARAEKEKEKNEESNFNVFFWSQSAPAGHGPIDKRRIGGGRRGLGGQGRDPQQRSGLPAGKTIGCWRCQEDGVDRPPASLLGHP